MSEPNQHEPGKSSARTSAAVTRSRWPGWIWAVPIAAFGVVAWLGINALVNRGIDVTIQFDRADGVSANDTNVEYRGIKLGKVTAIKLSEDGGHVVAAVNFHNSAKRYLTSGTRFWLEGATPSLSDPASIKGIIAGPTIELTPGPGSPSRHFVGSDHRPTLDSAPGSLVRYTVFFDGAVGQLKSGAPVTLRGFTVGEVESVALRYNAATGRLDTPVVFALEPSRLDLGSEAPGRPVQARLNRVLDHLIGEGLRAELGQSPPLIGDYAISLDFLPGGDNAHLDTSGAMPIFPAAPGGGGASIIQRVNQIPIDKIAAQVLAITNQVHAIVSSPSLHQSVVHLNQTLASLDRTVHQSGPQITALITSLRDTAGQLDTTINAANRVLGAAPTGQDNNVRVALHELTETARSVRALADYLDRHPEALLRGNAG